MLELWFSQGRKEGKERIPSYDNGKLVNSHGNDV